MDGYSLMVARFPGQNQEHPDSSGYVIGLQETLLMDEPQISKIRPVAAVGHADHDEPEPLHQARSRPEH